MASRVTEFDFGGVSVVEVGLFAGTGDVVGAVKDGLHPAEAAVAGGADFGVVGHGRKSDEGICPPSWSCKAPSALRRARDDFALAVGTSTK